MSENVDHNPKLSRVKKPKKTFTFIKLESNNNVALRMNSFFN